MVVDELRDSTCRNLLPIVFYILKKVDKRSDAWAWVVWVKSFMSFLGQGILGRPRVSHVYNFLYYVYRIKEAEFMFLCLLTWLSYTLCLIPYFYVISTNWCVISRVSIVIGT